VGLALGGGGARGLSHIGVIKTLVDNNIPINFIAGTSIGALVGGLYALKSDINWLESIALNNNWRGLISLLDPTFRQGFLAGNKVRRFINKNVGDAHFSRCKIPFTVVATEIRTGEAVIINKGELAPAIRASVSAPLVFRPVKMDDMLLVDGGLSMQVPVSVVRSMGADIVIAVNLDGDHFVEEDDGGYGWYRIAHHSLNIVFKNLAEQNVKDADIVIAPRVGNIGWGRFDSAPEAIEAGMVATSFELDKIKSLLGK